MVWPNPSPDGSFTIRLPEYLRAVRLVNVSVYRMNGQKILGCICQDPSADQVISINLTGSGMYALVFNAGDSVEIIKLLVK